MLPVVVLALLASVLGAVPAAAAPVPGAPALAFHPAQPPDNAEEAAAQLEIVQHEAEALTEQWHAAQDELDTRRQELDTLRAAVAPTVAAADAARGREAEFRQQADSLITSTFESGNLDQFNALLAAESPQDFLDQMAVLEMLASDQRTVLDELTAIVEEATAAQADADAAVAGAQQATDAAAAAEADLATRRTEADARVRDAEDLLEELTPAQRTERRGATVDAPAIPSGGGVGVEALRFAATQLGKDYEYGAEGPNTFDCSGLTSWAFSRAGVTLPRSSSQQARVGTEVSFSQLQPGDLVFYYSPISHVAIYAGDGRVINAPRTGDVVKYANIRPDDFTTARRI